MISTPFSTLLLVGAMMLPASAAEPPEAWLVVTGRDRAVVVDGKRLVLDRGERAGGVRLLRADSSEVVLEIDGREVVLKPGIGATPVLEDVVPARPETVTLWADRDGFFHADGRINGRPVRFLVDTGANTIALSSELAEKLGIDYEEGDRGYANTAGGMAPVRMVRLREVSVGSITVRDLEAGVMPGRHPETPLLGAPFLERVKMIRSGPRMELLEQ